MTFEIAVAASAALASVTLGGVLFWRDPRSAGHRAFCLGMIALAGRELASAFAGDALYPDRAQAWYQVSLTFAAVVPVAWLYFSLVFSRKNSSEFVRKWRLVLVAAAVIPVALVSVGRSSLALAPVLEEAAVWRYQLGSTGYALHVTLLLSAVLILMNVESTLRAATGGIRWQIKFLLMGVGIVFANQVYVSSQAILFASSQSALFVVSAGVLLLADALIVVSMFRSRLHDADVYLSDSFLYNSITLLFVGAYLLLLGGLIEAIRQWGGASNISVLSFFVLLSLLALAVVLSSNEFRQRTRGFVHRHLRRPSYDYRQIWDSFSNRTSALIEVPELCAAVTGIVSETFGCGAATVWLRPVGERGLVLAGSSSLSASRAHRLLAEHDSGRILYHVCPNLLSATPVDVRNGQHPNDEFLEFTEIQHVIPLVAAQEHLGFLSINGRVTREPYSFEDVALLKTFADQTAANVLKLRVSEQLQKAREMETFQTLSAFFVHDLKNLANRLSLALQNLPTHYDNPDFRRDFLKSMEQALEKIDRMTGRLSSLTTGLDVHREPLDLNGLVQDAMEGLNGTLSIPIDHRLEAMETVMADGEQIHRVITNLILNAHEACGDAGHILVETLPIDGWAVLSVTDDGCGMTPSYVEESLFRPFRTTKKQGLGIGLFHSKKIVEAHGGRIEVDTREGKGSTFRVLLPGSDIDEEDNNQRLELH